MQSNQPLMNRCTNNKIVIVCMCACVSVWVCVSVYIFVCARPNWLAHCLVPKTYNHNKIAIDLTQSDTNWAHARKSKSESEWKRKIPFSYMYGCLISSHTSCIHTQCTNYYWKDQNNTKNIMRKLVWMVCMCLSIVFSHCVITYWPICNV